MDNSEWKSMSSLRADESKGDARPVIVWHIFQGAMVYYERRDALLNRFCAYWTEPPATWNNPRKRPPTEEDADELSCVLGIDDYGKMRVRSLRDAQNGNGVRLWARIPAPPKDYLFLRKNAM